MNSNNVSEPRNAEFTAFLGSFLVALKCLVCVVGNAQKQVTEIFGYADVQKLDQKDMDEVIQAVIYTSDSDCFIAHQDRPYVVDLHSIKSNK